MARNTYDKDEDLEETYNFGQLKRLGKYVKPHIKTMIFITLQIGERLDSEWMSVG